jgi:hypothetical protein
MTDRTSRDCRHGAYILQSVAACLTIGPMAVVWRWSHGPHLHPTASDWSSVWPIALGLLAFAIGMISLGLSYGLYALADLTNEGRFLATEVRLQPSRRERTSAERRTNATDRRHQPV